MRSKCAYTDFSVILRYITQTEIGMSRLYVSDVIYASYVISSLELLVTDDYVIITTLC